MKLSWSQKLFLYVNQHVGEHPAFDAVMRFLANRLISFLLLAVATWLGIIFAIGDRQTVFSFLILAGVALFFSSLVSYAFALLWRHRRPIDELRMVKQLFSPLGTWKAFPSDHTIVVTIMPLVVAYVDGPEWFVLLLGATGLAIAMARVYAGVHYPRDIIGGAIIAGICTLLATVIF